MDEEEAPPAEPSIVLPEETEDEADNAGAPRIQETPEGDSPETEADTGEEPDGLAAEAAEDIAAVLRETQPSWQPNIDQDTSAGWTPPPLGAPTYADNGLGGSSKTDYQAPFPEAVTAEQVEQIQQSITQSNRYGFELEKDSIDNDLFTVDIHVSYGEINNDPPDGMTTADDFVFTIPGTNDGEEIYAIITYDIDTLDVTSRSLAHALTVPDSVIGTLYVPIGFIHITYAGSGDISDVICHNRQCGDIAVAFVYGAQNGARAIIPLRMYDDWVAVP